MVKRARFSSYVFVPLMCAAGFTIASLVFIFVLKDSSPVGVFAFFGIVQFLCMTLFAFLPDKAKNIPRHVSMFIIGMTLLVLAGLLGKQNFQIEGFFFFTFAGVFGGATVHYMMAKVIGPVVYGRTFCGWSCWSAFLFDLLPYKNEKKENLWKGGIWKYTRYIHFLFSAIIVALLLFAVGYSLHGESNAVRAAVWFAAGNGLYYAAGIVLAVSMRDNRAFCKYLCPAAVFAKFTNVFSFLRIKGESEKCTRCGSCSAKCPMSIDIPGYLKSEGAVRSTECVMCMNCIAACPRGILKGAVIAGVVKNDLLIEK